MINACELIGWLYNLQMIETIIGNEDVGKLEMCSHSFFLFTGYATFLGKTQLRTKLYPVILYQILQVLGH